MGLVLGVVGGRNFKDKVQLYSVLNAIHAQKEIDMIVSGGAKGADELAYRYAVSKGFTFVCHPPKPEDGFPRAYFRRNVRIVEHCDMLVAFPTKESKGTHHSIGLAKRLGKKVMVWD